MRALLMSNSTNAGGGSWNMPRAVARAVGRGEPSGFRTLRLSDHDGTPKRSPGAVPLVDVVGAHTLSLAEIKTAPAYFVGGATRSGS